ncbi:hypothetical protein [Mycobacterium sp. OTB74]|uniref:hypothetical protein n=1 Tax=Mycobacterium sp. OTB74 TaxID=1853452 RepID=UPI0024749690|nr:hypothetical protein [Mycobacterium sp. OTB74]MDH6243842.1 hypothetical protein [Mycobacterium sp. OTB74]
MKATAGPRSRLTTPHAAAIAGVLFALLFGVALICIRTALPEGAERGAQFFDDSSIRLRVAGVLMPFAGIAFLWFIGVLRDGFGALEDKFFASVFLGSGLVFLSMIFASTAVGAGLMAVSHSGLVSGVHDEVMEFGRALLIALASTFALRMAAVFMISSATIWLKTGLMPKWLVVLTYVVAVGNLIAGDVSLWIVLTFPVWVLVVSVLLLVRAGVIMGDD